MPREIQDSDDDLDVTTPTHPDGENQPSLVKAVSKTPSRTKSTNGTSSTDRLMREIQHAQQVLIGSSPARPTHSRVDPASPPLRASKRRKTTNSSQAGTPEPKLERRKTIKTYGSSSSRTQGLLKPGSSLFDDLKAGEQKSPDATITQREETEPEHKSSETIWDLPASLRQDFQEHEPVSMFPDPSSTVPDNTMTQQRLLEQALSNQMLPPPAQQSEEAVASTTSSFPWSTYLEQSPENKTQTPTKITQISQMLIPDETSPATGDPRLLTKKTSLFLASPNTPPGSPVRLSRTPTSISKKPSSGKLRRTKTMGEKTSSKRYPGDFADELALKELKSTAKRQKSHALGSLSHTITVEVPTRTTADEGGPPVQKSTGRRRKSHASDSLCHPMAEKEPENLNRVTHTPFVPEPVQYNDVETLPQAPSCPVSAASEDVDRALALNVAAMLSQMHPVTSLQTAAPTLVGTSYPVVPRKQKGKEKETAQGKEVLPLDSDDLTIGLPKEQYKPRPSRSRSARIVEDTSIDYSKRPEKLAASKLKRRKTTSEVMSAPPVATVDAGKMAQIGSMGFTPRQTKAALEESSGNVERAVESLLAQSTGGKENSPSKKPTKTRSKSTKQPKSSKQPELASAPSELLTVQVTQGSGNKTFFPTVDEVGTPKLDVASGLDKEKDLEDEIGLDAAPLPPAKSASEKAVTKEHTTQIQNAFKQTSSTQKRRRDRIADSDEEDEINAESELSRPMPKHASKKTVIDCDDEDEIAAECEPKPPKLDPKTHPKRKIIDSDVEDDLIAGPELQKVTPKLTAKRTKSLPAKKAKTIDESDDIDVVTTTQPAKRGRGRPKKVTEPVMDIEQAKPAVAEPVGKHDDKANPPQYPESEAMAAESEEPEEKLQTPSSTPQSAAMQPSTPEQHSGSSQKSAATKVAAQHSPLNKSKVPLRVGLSRKKRIAPLLKMIKK